MDVTGVVDRVAAELRAAGTPDRAEGEKRYLKSDFVHFGVPLPVIRKVAVATVRDGPDRADLLALADALWTATDAGRPVHDLRMAAIEVLVKRVALLLPADLSYAERLIRDSRSWAYVDALAERVVGDLAARTPGGARTLDAWIADPYFWIRRTALLALLPGIRSGAPDLDRLSRYGDAVLTEREFFIRKALGWVLREQAKKDPGWVQAWVAARIDRISGVTFREAARHLPEPAATRLRAAYAAR